MPVSTRSQVSGSRGYELNPVRRQAGILQNNPHQRLREKMEALTLLYEKHNMASKKEADHGSTERKIIATHHSSVDLFGSNGAARGARVMRRESVVPPSPSKFAERRSMAMENHGFDGSDHILAYSCPNKADLAEAMTTRKLSVGPETKPGIGRELGARILVFVRLRPMAKKEKDAGSRCCVKIVNRRDVYLTEDASELDYLRLKRLRGRHFCFDAAFPDASTQQEVYTATTAELVEGVLQGRNGSVFCYGATGAGKTYTMLGTVESPGVMVLAIKDLFAKIRQKSLDGNHSVRLSYLEVYNETVRDLLSPGRPLVLREDKQGIIAAGLTQYRAYSTEEVMALLQQGNLNRTTEPTRANETSSRSHAILQVVVEYLVKESGNVVNRVGKLSLIDLAGSERALATDQRSQRSVEGANINRSLLALSSCINALVEGKKHIPYRNSKLTQLLKDSLGGPCNTVMIANISPSNLSFSETQNTLHWADRAKEIRTKVCEANEEVVQVPETATDQVKLILELQMENSNLRQQLAHQKQKILEIQVQTMAFKSPPAPSVANFQPQASPRATQSKPKRSILSGSCFGTPESKKKEASEKVVQLQCRVRALEAEMERLKTDHTMQLRQKDEFIQGMMTGGGEKVNTGRVITRGCLRKVGMAAAAAAVDAGGELKSPSHRFRSPVQAAKKRSFWDITTANSPSVLAARGRKTKSHVSNETAPSAPSMLLQLACQCFWLVYMWAPHVAGHAFQPGFASRRADVRR